jgi:Flp pilus assembly protein TadD
MLDLDAFKEFREGLAQLRDGQATNAVELLRQATQRDPENPYYMSYLGLSLGHAEGMWAEAERLCHTAVCRGRRQAQLYLNLSEVYLCSGRRRAAADTLARGLHYLPHDSRLQLELGRLLERRHPVLRFLPREHVANRALGQLRFWFVNHLPRRRWLEPTESRA